MQTQNPAGVQDGRSSQHDAWSIIPQIDLSCIRMNGINTDVKAVRGLPHTGLAFGQHIPLSISSFVAFSFLGRCDNPMPRRTFGALVNWMLS